MFPRMKMNKFEMAVRFRAAIFILAAFRFVSFLWRKLIRGLR